MLDEETICSGVHIKIIYLVARAILGMIKINELNVKWNEQKLSNKNI